VKDQNGDEADLEVFWDNARFFNAAVEAK